MTPNLEVHSKLFQFLGALSVLSMAAAWWRAGSEAEDEAVVQAADLVLDSAADADLSKRIEAATGRDLRSQMTVAEAEELRREAELRKFGRRN